VKWGVPVFEEKRILFSFSDTIRKNISIVKPPLINLGNDTAINISSSIILKAGYYGILSYYLWDDGSNYQYRIVKGNDLGIGVHKIL